MSIGWLLGNSYSSKKSITGTTGFTKNCKCGKPIPSKYTQCYSCYQLKIYDKQTALERDK